MREVRILGGDDVLQLGDEIYCPSFQPPGWHGNTTIIVANTYFMRNDKKRELIAGFRVGDIEPCYAPGGAPHLVVFRRWEESEDTDEDVDITIDIDEELPANV